MFSTFTRLSQIFIAPRRRYFDELAVVKKNRDLGLAINNLKDNRGAHKPKIRVGRGQAARRGHHAGRGLKGQLSRTSGRPNKGGQNPHWKSIRKHGFTNAMFARTYAVVNLHKLQFWIDTKRIDAAQKITMRTLFESGCVGKLRRSQVGVKLLGQGATAFNHKIDIEVSQASTSAIESVKKNGGTIDLVYYNRVGLHWLKAPHHFKKGQPYFPRPPDSINKKLRKPMNQPYNPPRQAEQELGQELQRQQSENSS